MIALANTGLWITLTQDATVAAARDFVDFRRRALHPRFSQQLVSGGHRLADGSPRPTRYRLGFINPFLGPVQ